MSQLQVERIGGLAGFGGPGAHIRSHGELEFSSLSEADRKSVENLFKGDRIPSGSAAPDGFSYRISRHTGSGVETIEVHEDLIPAAIAACVKDELI